MIRLFDDKTGEEVDLREIRALADALVKEQGPRPSLRTPEYYLDIPMNPDEVVLHLYYGFKPQKWPKARKQLTPAAMAAIDKKSICAM